MGVEASPRACDLLSLDAMGDQHDDLRQDIKESDAPEHLAQVHELASLRVTESDEANAEDSQNSIRKLSKRRANVGVHPAGTCMPEPSDAIYEHNHQDPFEFLSIIVRRCGGEELRYEVLR